MDWTSGAAPNSKKNGDRPVHGPSRVMTHEPPWEQRQRRRWPALRCADQERAWAWQRPFAAVPARAPDTFSAWVRPAGTARAHGALTTAEPPCPAVRGAAGIGAALSASLPAVARPCGPPSPRTLAARPPALSNAIFFYLGPSPSHSPHY
ncbi:hypothetical protein ZWY2020_006742 [Hordeum vulgare]|nr:hypothetical protein ZWY2020_000454 [Hordeum vulgare]KAI4972915.1 hypothetical protein ZWY2020_006742 [Hordeum vulgare]